MDLITVMLIVWAIKVLAEDGWATVKGTSNPRMDRRKARQKSRAGNPIWNQFIGWLGDVAEDARQELARAREEKRQRQAEVRRKRDLEEHPTVDAEYTIDSAESNQERSHDELSDDECTLSWCPVHGKGTVEQPEDGDVPSEQENDRQTSTNQTGQDQQGSSQSNEGDNTMSEITGLDQSIAYASSLKRMAGSHGTAGNEGYIGHLNQSQVTGQALASGHEMQAAFSAAMAAAEKHEGELLKQKAIQEQYDANPDAGNKDFQTTGR